VRVAKRGVVGISFDHMHMGDLLREVAEHPGAEIAGIFDPDRARMEAAIARFGIPQERVFTDLEACLSNTRADLAIICSATADHARYVEEIAPHGLHVLVEKPFAGSVADARRMIASMEGAGRRLAINWPLAWVRLHVTAKRLVDEGAIGDLIEVHYYDGNRGPLFHLAEKVEVSVEEVEAQKPTSWWYKKAAGGGSLRDYLGYGVTLGTWYMGGEAPVEVTCVVDETPGIEVDQHSVTVARYRRGLSKFETRWGTFTDPWTLQPQPKCGFVLVGSHGTISSYDYEDHVTVQTREQPSPTQLPVDTLPAGRRSPIEYMLARIDDGAPIAGPLDPSLSLVGQRIVDSAVLSAETKRTVALVA
jgi:glucose-fructose oxidoreductase